MAQRVPIRCRSCGRVYTARQVGDEFTIPTDDGACRCGNDDFENVTLTVAGADGEAS